MTETVSFGYEEVSPEEKAAKVGAVFSNVASRYDLMNDAMSAGMHRLWKDRFVRRVKPREGEMILDMAGGTGDIAFRMQPSGALVTVADINAEMLDVGIERAQKREIGGLSWSQQDAERLSFDDRSFDAYTIAFGIRNVTHIDRALREAHRVLKPGGKFQCLEFSHVDMPGLASIYDAYSFTAIPAIGKVVTGDGAPYRYLVESIRTFPDQEKFEGMIREAGFARTGHRSLSGGIVAIHWGWRI